MISIYDDNGQEKRVTERFNGSGPLEKKLTRAEQSVVKEVCAVTGVHEKTSTIREHGHLVKVSVKGYLIFEEGWKNGYVESFNGKLRDELLNREIFETLLEAKVLVERWRREYNQIRPRSSLSYLLPAPEAILSVCDNQWL